MAKNRKEHRKACRLNGIQQKIDHQKKLEHKRDLETLQKVLDHSDALRLKRPELFAAVMRSVNALAVETGVSVDSIMRDGVLMLGDDGHTIAKSPREIIDDIASLHVGLKDAGSGIVLNDGSVSIIDKDGAP